MTVAELIAKLREMPQDMRVLTNGDDRVDYRQVDEVKVKIVEKGFFTENLDFGNAEEMTAVVIV